MGTIISTIRCHLLKLIMCCSSQSLTNVRARLLQSFHHGWLAIPTEWMVLFSPRVALGRHPLKHGWMCFFCACPSPERACLLRFQVCLNEAIRTAWYVEFGVTCRLHILRSSTCNICISVV